MHDYDYGIWYHIPGFNGYQINDNYVVRSMKMMHANPGHCLKRYGSKDNPYYKLTNDNNERVNVTLKELVDRTFNSGNNLYPVYSDDVYLGSRNKVFTKSMKKDRKYDNMEAHLTIMNNVVDDGTSLTPIIRFYN